MEGIIESMRCLQINLRSLCVCAALSCLHLSSLDRFELLWVVLGGDSDDLLVAFVDSKSSFAEFLLYWSDAGQLSTDAGIHRLILRLTALETKMGGELTCFLHYNVTSYSMWRLLFYADTNWRLMQYYNSHALSLQIYWEWKIQKCVRVIPWGWAVARSLNCLLTSSATVSWVIFGELLI